MSTDGMTIKDTVQHFCGCNSLPQSRTGIVGEVEIKINGVVRGYHKNFISNTLINKLAAAMTGAPINNIRPSSLIDEGWEPLVGGSQENNDGICIRVKDNNGSTIIRTLETEIIATAQPHGVKFRGTAIASGVSGSAGEAATGTFFVTNSPLQESDQCSGTGTNKTYVAYPTSGDEYCFTLPNNTKSVIATVLSNFITSSVPGLTAVNLGGTDPEIRISSTNLSAVDNGKDVILKVPTALEPDPTVFSTYTIGLSGGVDPTSNASIDAMYLGRNFTGSSNAFGVLFSHLNAGNSNLNFEFFLENGDEITVNWDVYMMV